MKNIWPKVAAGLVMGLIVFAGLALFADLKGITASIGRFEWGYLPLIAALTVFSYALRFLKWHYYIGLVGAQDLRWPESLRIFVSGFPLAMSPGKLAEPMKALWLNQYTGVPVARGVPVVLAERISDGLGMGLLSTLGVIAFPAYWPGFVLVLLGLVGVMVVSQIRPLALWVIALAERLPVVSRASHHLREFYEGVYQLFGLKAALIGVGLGVVGWLGEGLGFYYVLRGLGMPSSHQVLFAAVFVFSFSTIVGAVSSLPGGLGAAEASIAGLLTLTLAASAETAASATMIIRLLTLWFGVALGLVVLLSSRRLLGLEPPASGRQSLAESNEPAG